MIKLRKFASIVLSASLMSTGAGYVKAQGTCEFDTDCRIEDLDIALDSIGVTEKNTVNVAFSIENYGTDKQVNVSMRLLDKNMSEIAGSKLTRSVKSGESVPVKFTKTRIADTEDMTFSVYVKDETKRLQTEVYVANDGNDKESGTATNPLKTVSGAFEVVKGFNSDGDHNGKDIKIIVDNGNYDFPNTLNIADTDISNLSSLTIEGEGKNTVFYSGIKVKGSDFTKVTDLTALSMFDKSVEGKIYSLDLSKYGVNLSYTDGTNVNSDPIYTTVSYNSKTEQIAKYPNSGYGKGSIRLGKDSENRKTQIKSAEIKNWKNIEEAWVRSWLLYDWDITKGKIASITDSVAGSDIDSTITGRTLTLQRLFCGSMPSDDLRPISKQDRDWYVYNIPSELDIEGEYVIKDNVLYYYPAEADVSNNTFKNADITVNTSNADILNIQSSKNVTVKNIAFENTQGYFINANADNVSVAGCTFANGMNAVNVKGNNNIVSACDFSNLGGSGLVISGGDVNTLTGSNSKVENCLFNRVSQINRTNCAPLVLKGCGVTARRNTVTDTPHLAVSYNGNNHIIEYNDIYNCLTDRSSDAGIVYSGNDLSNLGTVVQYNYIHDSYSGLGAVYYDDWLSGQSAVGNVFENVDRVLLVHGGIYNTFRDNIVINSDIGAFVRHKDRFKTIDGVKYNVWDEINGRYNGFNNVFLGKLVGIPESNGTEPGVSWKSEVWQNAYGDILAYVNNKTDNKASNTWISNNYFVNTDTPIYPYGEMKMADLILNNNSTGNTALDAQHKTQYDNVVNNCGIYTDSFRKNK